ncbi:hypothetical protein GDO81_010061 [Engystomops pustulosus]|uniref:Uncharacterized protein n=1 Tax=Engystomops pustulosus TaxID=76066 RepID=A0AAV7BWK2_ENGPU|nr:hypothetical protein GDO81_010061 [Engystomops pustulosus]
MHCAPPHTLNRRVLGAGIKRSHRTSRDIVRALRTANGEDWRLESMSCAGIVSQSFPPQLVYVAWIYIEK